MKTGNIRNERKIDTKDKSGLLMNASRLTFVFSPIFTRLFA